MSLIGILADHPFEKWGIDFIGPISPAAKHTQARYIIVAIDFFTKWAKARATKKNDARSTAKFLYEQVIMGVGCPLQIVSDRGTHFINETITILLSEFMIIHRKSTPYYPQANGLAESSNKNFCKIMICTVEGSRNDWEHKLTASLWAYQTAYKVATNCTPFSLAFGMKAVMPMEFVVPSLRVTMKERLTEEPLAKRSIDLEKLEETRLRVAFCLKVEKIRRKRWFDRNLKNKDLAKGDLALLYSIRNTKRKLKYRGMGPY